MTDKKLLDMTDVEFKALVNEILDLYFGNIKSKDKMPTYTYELYKKDLIKLSEKYGVFK